MAELLLEWVLTSMFLILVVLALRAALGRRVSARLRYALWAVVLVRLLVPVQLFHLPIAGTWIQTEKEIQRDVYKLGASPVEEGAIERLGDVDGPTAVLTTGPDYFHLPDAPTVPDAPEPPAAPDLTKAPAWLGWAWLTGAASAALVLLASNLRFYRELRRVRIPLNEADCPLPVYEAANLPSPCLFGIVRPAVCVTPEAAADPDMLRHVLAHEYTHYRHGDHLWSLLRCAALAVHWWNPLVWLAAELSRRDAELACDEGALKRLGDGERAGYGSTLLALVTAKPRPGDLFRCATTMAGDKKSLKERVSRIARAPRRWLWAAALAVLVTALACVCAFGQAEPVEPSDQVDEFVLTYTMGEDRTVLVEGLEGAHVEWSRGTNGGSLYLAGDLGFCCPRLADEKTEGGAFWEDGRKSLLHVHLDVNDDRILDGAVGGFRISFTVDMNSGAITQRVFTSQLGDRTIELTDQEMVGIARALAKPLTEAEEYYLSQQREPADSGHAVPDQVRADAEEFVRERFEALRDKGISYGIDGTAGIVSDPPELDGWRIERLTGPYWCGETYWEVLGINRRVELWNVVYAYHSTTPDKAWNLANGATQLTEDGWLTPINYGAEYLVYELGEDGGRNLLTVFGEQGEVLSVGFRRNLRVELARGGVPEDMQDAYTVEEQAGFPLSDLGRELDLNRNGVPEYAQVVNFGGMGERLELWEGGRLVFAEEGYYAHAGYNALFLCTLDGEDYLLRYNPYMAQGWCDYTYQLFTLENGVETVVRENHVEFDINFGSLIHIGFDPEAIAAFMDEVNGLLAHSVQLLNTDSDLLDIFQKEGRLYDSHWWLDGWAPTFVRDETASMLENLRAYKAAMEAQWYAEEPELTNLSETAENARVWLRYRDKDTQFDADCWDFTFQPAESVDIQVFDLNGDGRDELVFPLVWGRGTGVYIEKLYVFDAETLEQYDTSGLNERLLNSIASTGDGEKFYLSGPGMDRTIPKSEAEKYNEFAPMADTLALGEVIRYTIKDGQVSCRLGCDASGAAINYIGYVNALVRMDAKGNFSCGGAQYVAEDLS